MTFAYKFIRVVPDRDHQAAAGNLTLAFFGYFTYLTSR
jgi:hypothetical protein